MDKSLAIIVMILLFVVVVTTYLLYAFNRQKHRRIKGFRKEFSLLAVAYDLSFSAEELLNHLIIGLDGIHRKLLIVKESETGRYAWDLIYLDEVKSCFTLKEYRHLGGNTEKHAWAPYPEKVVLVLEFKDERPRYQIPFYSQLENQSSIALERINKARDWELILSKMLQPPFRRII
jgi:hypothetical protein